MDFKDEFDFISEKAKQLTDTGIRKADEVIGISKLKLRCIKIDALIKAKYTELGRTMYGMVKNDSSDADRIAQAVMDIDHLYKKMAQCNGKIKGNIEISGKIMLDRDSVIIGDIKAGSIAISDGAVINGFVTTTYLSKDESANIFPENIALGD